MYCISMHCIGVHDRLAMVLTLVTRHSQKVTRLEAAVDMVWWPCECPPDGWAIAGIDSRKRGAKLPLSRTTRESLLAEALDMARNASLELDLQDPGDLQLFALQGKKPPPAVVFTAGRGLCPGSYVLYRHACLVGRPWC
jgi:hypothetical protein